MPTYVKYVIITLVACLLFFPLLGHVHLFDWDEINFAECAREMIVSKDYLRAQIDFMPFWEKPPVFIWMQVIAMKLFGVGDYAARFPNAFMGVVTLVTLFYVGRKVMNERMATWWTLLYAATWLPHFYFKSGIIDPTFNYFIFLAVFQVHLLRNATGRVRHAIFAGLFLGIAVLTKGPVAVLVAGLSLMVYFVVNRGLNGIKPGHLLVIALFAALPMLLWLGSAVAFYGLDYGKWFMGEFLTYQVRLFSTEDADHGGPFLYHFIVLLAGCFPASAFLFQYSRKRGYNQTAPADFTRWMWILFWVVLLLFSIVKTKIVHYSSLCYFPLTFLAAAQISKLASGEIKLRNGVRILLFVLVGLIGIAITALPVVGLYKDKLLPYIDDPFAVGNLQAAVSWSPVECMWGAGYIVASFICIALLRRNFRRAFIALCVVQLIIIQATVIHFTPKIEAYSQRAAIKFYEGFQGQNVYIRPLGFKSYAYLFYARKQPFAAKDYYADGKVNEHWLMYGAVDKPVYFVGKIQDAAKLDTNAQLTEIGRMNGFVFFRRK